MELNSGEPNLEKIVVNIENNFLQDDIINFSGWKLYNLGKLPSNRRLDELYIKKVIDGEIIVKSFLSTAEEESDDKIYLKNSFEEVRKINPDEVAFQLDKGIHQIPVGDGFVEVDYQFSDKIYTVGHDLFPYKSIFLRGTEKHIEKFISEMDHYIKRIDKAYIKVFSPTGKGYWDLISKNIRREVDTVFIKDRDEILADIEEFMNSESDYQIFGHPYKRNYLFYGPPGNGKTSFINAIASKYNFRIYMLSFSNAINDEVFKKLVSTIPRNAILVMEDIDALFDDKKNISMSTVLNIMDGLARKSRIISLMTTNNYHKLTDVFKRPGRIDMTVEFTKADEECFQEMAEFMCKFHKKETNGIHKVASNFFNQVSYMEPSRALVQKFLFENRKKSPEEIFSSKMIQKFKDLHNIYCHKSEEIALYS